MIKKRRMSKYLLMACLLCFVSGVQGQSFMVSAAIEKIPATGFYQITVTPELSAYARADNGDIRITAPDGSYVPYITRTNTREGGILEQSAPLTIMTNEADSNNTVVILKQDSATWTNGISLIMANTSVERYAQISGSNDNKHWYIIDDHILLQRTDDHSKGNYSQSILFPRNKYTYYKLKINNAHTDPLNITGARANHGFTLSTSIQSHNGNPAPTVSQQDSNNHISYVVIRNLLPFIINKFSLSITGPKFYERNARIFIMPTDKDTSIKYEVASVTLKSGTQNTFTIQSQKAKTIFVEIDNNDDPPLKITEAGTFQQTQYLVAWLENDKQYSIVAGNEQARAPQYDLSRFNDSIPGQLPEVKFGTLSKTKPITTTVIPPPGTSGKWLWVIIIAFVMILSLLTYKLMKDAQRKDTIK